LRFIVTHFTMLLYRKHSSEY